MIIDHDLMAMLCLILLNLKILIIASTQYKHYSISDNEPTFKV